MSATGDVTAPPHRVERRCRACAAPGLEPVLELGAQPLADAFLPPARRAEADRRYPLTLALCPACGLAQILETVPREVLFGPDYPYLSSCSATVREHARRLALDLERAGRVGPGRLAVEIASNDGYLLRHLAATGARAVGVEPSPLPAAAARALGLTVVERFFDAALAREMVAEWGRADLVVASNVLAHAEDLHGMVAGIATLLDPAGAAIVEFGYVGDLVAGGHFDHVYHEHLCHFSLASAAALLARHGLRVISARRVAAQGGSLRLTVARAGPADPGVAALAAAERRAGLDRVETYARLASLARRTADALGAYLEAAAARGRRVAGYGAAAKGTVLLNHAGVTARRLPLVADANPAKQGTLVPGTGIPVVSPEALARERPEAIVVLPWNLRAELRGTLAAHRARGAQIVFPGPDLPAPRGGHTAPRPPR